MLGVQVCDPRDVAILVVYPGDGAPLVADESIDLAATDLRAYWDSMFDLSHLAYKEGQKPTLWRIRPLTRAQRRHVPSTADPMELADWYVRCGVLAVRDRPIADASGAERPTPQPEMQKAGALGEVIAESWLDRAQLTDPELLALYRMIRHLSEAQAPLPSSSVKPRGDTPSSVATTEQSE